MHIHAHRHEDVVIHNWNLRLIYSNSLPLFHTKEIIVINMTLVVHLFVPSIANAFLIWLIYRSTATSDLKDRLVRIESTSESKSQSGHSLGRAAQLILAASGKRSAPSSPSQTAPINRENPSTSSSLLATTPTAASSSSSTSSKRGKGKNKISVLEQPPDDAVILLEEQVKEFLIHIGPALKDATLTGIQQCFPLAVLTCNYL